MRALIPILLVMGFHSGPSIGAPTLYTFVGTSGVIVDELGLVKDAGLMPTGEVQYQYVVDLDRSEGSATNQFFMARLVSMPYLVRQPSNEQFVMTSRAQSYSVDFLAGSIAAAFDGKLDTPVYGDAYLVGVAVSSFSDPSVLIENWVVGGMYGGFEAYRSLDGQLSHFTAPLRLTSIEPYQINEPSPAALLLAATIVILGCGRCLSLGGKSRILGE